MKYLIIAIFNTLLLCSCNSTQEKQSDNSQSKLEEQHLSNSKKPDIVCTDEYMEVTKDTYNYYLKKLKHSGLLEILSSDVDETIQRKINSDEIICFLSLTEYGEEENILIEPFQAEIDKNIFNVLKNAIESQQVTKDEENITFRLLDSGESTYGKSMPYYYFKTITLIKDIYFIRYSLTYLINIDGKPYLIVINTHDVEKNINNTILSINNISSNETATTNVQVEQENHSASATIKDNGKEDDSIIFLDGAKVSKSLIVNSCVEYTKKEGLDKLIIADNYCTCFADRVGENFNSTDVSFLFKGMKSEKELYAAAIRFYSLPIVKEFVDDCIKNNLTDSNENFSISSEEEKKALIAVFKNGLRSQVGYEELKRLIDIDDFCECVVIKIFENFSYKEIMTNPNFGENQKFIQIQDDCMLKNRKETYY